MKSGFEQEEKVIAVEGADTKASAQVGEQVVVVAVVVEEGEGAEEGRLRAVAGATVIGADCW